MRFARFVMGLRGLCGWRDGTDRCGGDAGAPDDPRDLGRGGARHGEAGRQAGRGHVRLYAPDRDGNGWYLGEDTKEYENGKVASTKGSWEAGVNGALLGDLVVTKEWTRLERGTVEEKSYAPGIGLVLEAKVTGGNGRVQLTKFTRGG